MKLIVFALIFVFAVTAGAFAASHRIQLKAEDVLELPGLELTPDQTDKLNKLITMRRDILAGIKEETIVKRTTTFGDAMGEPPALEAWRAKEDKEVRANIPSGHTHDIEKFSQDIAQKEEKVFQTFPMKDDAPKWEVAQEVSGTQQAAAITLLVRVPVPSPLYTIRKDISEQKDDICVMKFSLVKPSNRMLIGKNPDPKATAYTFLMANDSDQLKTVMEAEAAKNGTLPETTMMPKLPSKFHIYVRPVTIDGPGLVDYQDLGIFQVAPIPVAPQTTQAN